MTESLKHLNQVSSAFGFWVFFHAVKVERNQKRKKKVKIVNNPFYIQQYLLAGNIEARIIHSRNTESEIAFK